MISFIEGQGDLIFVGGYGFDLLGNVCFFLKVMSIIGEEYWIREYQDNEYFEDVFLLFDGFVVVGGKGLFGIVEGQMLIKKVSYDGEDLWICIYDFFGRVIVNGIIEIFDGVMVFCGWVIGGGLVLFKID